MSGSLLRYVGTTAQFAPVLKRSIGTLSTGRAVALFIDTNLAASAGSDVTGVAKIYLNLSVDASRTSFTIPSPVMYTPAVPPASSTRYAVASMGIASDDSIWVAWQGTDNGLYVSKWSYNSTTHAITFVSTATVVASGAVVNRFRAIDIDVAGTTPIILTYEANASDGNAAFHRAYALKSDNVTWIRMFSITALSSGQFIRNGSEDVSIAARGDGVVSNVVRYLIYGTKTATSTDIGDVVREYSFNISSGAADSATLLGSWFVSLNKDNAAGSRRAMLFTLSSTLYLLAGVYGTSSPRFFATKLTTGSYSQPVITYAGYVATVALSNYFKIDSSYNARTAWSATYKDNRLSFGFASLGPAGSPRIAREIVFSWATGSTPGAKPTIDSVPRPLDSNRYEDGGPIGVYGGDNKRVASGLKAYNFQVFYGRSGNTVSTSWDRQVMFVAEDTFEAPVLVSPVSNGIEATNKPTYRVKVNNLNLTPNLYGKIELQVSMDSTFTTGVKSIIEDDSKFQYFGSKDGLANNTKTVTIPTLTISQSLSTGTWYWRARIVSDKDTPGAWTTYGTFSVSHPPSALPISPAPNQILGNLGSSIYFAWKFSDTYGEDEQSQYRVVVSNDSGLVSTDTGWVVSPAKQVGITFGSGFNEIPQRWTVQLRDQDGATGPESSPITFLLGYVPSVSIISPANASTVTTAAPTVTWSYSSAGNRLQRAYRVVATATSGPLAGEIVADTNWITSAATSHAFTTNIFSNGVDYEINLYVVDEGGLEADSTVSVDTDWIEPALAVMATAVDKFKVRVTWTNSAKDADWVAWRVYRRYMKVAASEMDLEGSGTSWVLVHETQDDITDYTFDDYLCPLNRTVDYVVVQLADRFGSLLESNITAYSTVTMTNDRYFFVPEVPVGSIASFEASDITGDQFAREVEQETIHVIGRGRHVQIGDDLGYAGSYTIKLRNPSTARLNREFLEYLSSQGVKVYVKSPFGDVILVSLGSVKTERQGGFGSGDIVNLTVDYTEIIAPDETIRLG